MCQVWYAWWIVNHIMTSVKMCGPPPAPGPSAESSLSWVMAFRKCTSMTHGQKEVLFIELMSFSHSHLYENRESKGFCLKPSYVYLSSWPFLYPCLSPSQKPLVSLAWRLLLVWLSSAERVKKKKNWWVAFWVIYNGILPICRRWWNMKATSAFYELILGKSVEFCTMNLNSKICYYC